MAETIQEYLVKLGFQVEQSQQNRFTDGLKSTRAHMDNLQKVVSKSIAGFYELATAAGGTAIAIATALGKIAMGMATMSFQAQRVGASAANIHALGFAFTQVGGSIEEANSALETYSTNLRMLPGFEEAVKSQYGITATDHAEQLKQIAAEMQKRVAAAGPEGSLERARAVTSEIMRAQALKVASEPQAYHMLQPGFNPAYNQAQGTESRTGADWNKAAAQGQEYFRLLKNIRDEFDNIKTRGYSEFADSMNAGLTKVEGFLKTHDKQIGDYLASMARNFDVATNAAKKWWESLDEEQQGKVQTGAVVAGGAAVVAGGAAALGGIGAALRIPGAAQIARIGAISIAILALKNDYEAWKTTEGKGSLIDWGKWEGPIKLLTDSLKFLDESVLAPLFAKLGIDKAFIPVFEGFAGFLATIWLPSIIKTFATAGLAVGGFWGKLSAINALLLAIQAWHKAQDPETYDLKNLPPTSPYWNSVPESVQREHPNSPINNPDALRSPFSLMMDRLLGRGSAAGAKNFQPLADTTIAPQDKSVLDAISIGESGGDYNAVNPKGGAAGRYQFIPSTNAEVSQQTGLAGFDPVSQDRKAIFYARQVYKQKTGRDLSEDAKDRARWPMIASALNKTWTSLPGGAESHMTMDQWNDRMDKPNAGATVAVTGPKPISPIPAGVGMDMGTSSVGDMIGRLKELGVSSPPIGMTIPPLPPPATMPAQRGDVTFNSQPNITVTGVSDPQLAANHVARASERQNADVLRRLQPVFA